MEIGIMVRLTVLEIISIKRVRNMLAHGRTTNSTVEALRSGLKGRVMTVTM